MALRIKNFSKTFVWILMGMLILGLGGFGALNLSGTVRTVATVGDGQVSVDDYARELQREIRALEAQTGQPLQMAQVREMGLDQVVLARLIAIGSLDNEVRRIGLSVGDANLQKEITAISGFQGPTGSFDRDTYKFQLEQAGISETEFETDLRAESARTLVQGAVMAGARMPATMTETIAGYIAARRSFTVATLTSDALEQPLPAVSDAELRAFYEAHPDRFTLPETRRLTYALLSPDAVMAEVKVEDEALRTLYEQRSDTYNLPERRLVERLVFADEQAASDAMAQIEVGGTTFEALVQDRGLDLADIDLGDVTRADLGAAAEAVFAAAMNQVTGPLPTDLGPALFRVNGVLDARTTAFEAVEGELRDELATERARRLIESRAESINDLLAGGATLEELEKEAGMELGQVDWTADASEGISAYTAFRDAAAAITADDYPEARFLDDGGLFALRLDEVLPPRPEPFEDARDTVIAAWALAQTETALRARADEVMAGLGDDGDLVATGLPLRTETGLTRNAFIEGVPQGFMTQVFAMEPGEVRVIGEGQAIFLVRLDEVLAPADNEEMRGLKVTFARQMDQALGQALFDAFVRDAQIRAKPMLDERALNAVQANFR
jgi:peptidyl-prolyl cis-trans isomerase D